MNLPRRKKRQKMGVRQPDIISCDSHLQWVRGHECLIGMGCQGRTEAHHMREGRHGGMNIKHDDTAVPLCNFHHMLGHSIGWQTFQRDYAIDLPLVAQVLWQRSPAGIRYRKARESA